MMIERKVKSIRALERGLDVLAEVQRSRGVSLHELHVRLGLPKATLLRLLVTLSSRGMVWQRMADGAYLPGTAAQTALQSEMIDRLAEIASPHLAALSARVNWPSIIAAPRLDHIEIIETNSPLLRLDSATLGPVGIKLSYLHTATGRAYLSACDERERETIINRIRPPNADADSLALLDQIVTTTRKRGYSTRDPHHPWADRSKQMVLRDGRQSIAVAVVAFGHAVAAINVTWPTRRTRVDDVVGRHFSTLQATAAAIGAALENSARTPPSQPAL